MLNPVRRFKESDRVRAADQAELDAAAAEITEFERRDVKYKEDRRHCKAKLKKAEEKLAKDAARLQARWLGLGSARSHLTQL